MFQDETRRLMVVRDERVMPYRDGVTGRGLARLAIGGDGRLRGSEGD